MTDKSIRANYHQRLGSQKKERNRKQKRKKMYKAFKIFNLQKRASKVFLKQHESSAKQ